MAIRLVRQPPGSTLCGQCCVAMAAGVCLDKATEAIDHQGPGGTTTREVITALRKLGLKCADRCRPLSRTRPSYPRRAILVLRKNGTRRYHWVYYEDGIFYDPEDEWPRYDGWRITSYLEVFG